MNKFNFNNIEAISSHTFDSCYVQKPFNIQDTYSDQFNDV